MKKGFTLVELIVVVTVVMLLGTIAVGMYFNTIRNFNYFTTFKNAQSVFRQARSFAISNASIASSAPDSFGIYLSEDDNNYRIFMFADNGESFKYLQGTDTIVLSKDYLIPKSKFDIRVFQGSDPERVLPLLFPMAFYYEKTTGDFKGFQGTGGDTPKAENPIDKSSANYIAIHIVSKENPALERFLVINQVSGLPEEYKTL